LAAKLTAIRDAHVESGHNRPMDTQPGPPSPTVLAGAPDAATARIYDRIALALIAIAALVALLTFRDYGLGWDDYAHSEYGDLLVAFYASGFADKRALSFVNLYMYGGGFDLLAALVAKLLPFTLFETRRLVGAAVGLVGLIVVWRTARRAGGPLAGLIALALLATCPLYIGHEFINAKDGPFAVAMAVLLFGLVRCFDEYPHPTPATVALTGLGFGLAIGSRIMGGFGVITALVALALVFIATARRHGVRPASVTLGHFVLALLPAVVLALAVVAVIWPWVVTDPLNLFHALDYFSRFFEKPWEELFDGKLIQVTDMPRSYVPTLLALKLPGILLVLGFGGMAGALIAVFRRDLTPNRRAVLLAIVLAALTPLAVTVLARPAMYNGIRHFVFVLPPLAVLGGLAGAWLLERLRQRAAVAALATLFVAGLALPIVDMGRVHPYEYTYFNRIAGGVAAARERYMLDYWALSFKQAAQGLKAKLAELKLAKPSDRRWKLATCGPHRSPQVELGPDFETTWDPKGADFALMLGEFYCVKLDAPVWVEVVRAGAVYARVYDIRGRNYDTLLTQPGL
jgi:4-amino-4-deoxy-L-arabinose transferase-like glycosyltransferase